MTAIHANATSASRKRKVAEKGRNAGNAGAVMGTKKKNGDAMIVEACVSHANAPLVAARKTSAGVGSGVPRDATKRSTTSSAISKSYTDMKNPRKGFTKRRVAAYSAWAAKRTTVTGQSHSTAVTDRAVITLVVAR